MYPRGHAGGALQRKLGLGALAALIAAIAGCSSAPSTTAGGPAGHSATATGSRSGAAGSGHSGSSSSSPKPASGGSTGGAGTGNSGSSASATRAVRLASRRVRAVRSIALTEAMSLQGLPTGAFGPAGTGTLSLTIAMKMQLKPALLADIKLNMHLGSRSLTIDQILTASAFYLDAPAIYPPSGGKPWTKVSLSDLPGGVSQSTLLKQLEEGDPMAATISPQALGDLLAAAHGTGATGGQVTGGVRTTEYSGTISYHAFLAELTAAERRSLASAPPSLRTSGLAFKIWIDHSHQVRKLDLRLGYSGVSIGIVVNVRSVNAPVSVSAPPASQVSN